MMCREMMHIHCSHILTLVARYLILIASVSFWWSRSLNLASVLIPHPLTRLPHGAAMVLNNSTYGPNTQIMMLTCTCLRVKNKLTFLIKLLVERLVVVIDVHLRQIIDEINVSLALLRIINSFFINEAWSIYLPLWLESKWFCTLICYFRITFEVLLTGWFISRKLLSISWLQEILILWTLSPCLLRLVNLVSTFLYWLTQRIIIRLIFINIIVSNLRCHSSINRFNIMPLAKLILSWFWSSRADWI